MNCALRVKVVSPQTCPFKVTNRCSQRFIVDHNPHNEILPLLNENPELSQANYFLICRQKIRKMLLSCRQLTVCVVLAFPLHLLLQILRRNFRPFVSYLWRSMKLNEIKWLDGEAMAKSVGCNCCNISLVDAVSHSAWISVLCSGSDGCEVMAMGAR